MISVLSKPNFRTQQFASKCRHVVTSNQIYVDGNKYYLIENPPLCFQCLRQKSTFCAWCDKEILVGSMVTLQTTNEDRAPSPVAATFTNEKIPFSHVGCVRKTCVFTESVWIGTWTYPGQVAGIGQGFISDFKNK